MLELERWSDCDRTAAEDEIRLRSYLPQYHHHHHPSHSLPQEDHLDQEDRERLGQELLALPSHQDLPSCRASPVHPAEGNRQPF